MHILPNKLQARKQWRIHMHVLCWFKFCYYFLMINYSFDIYFVNFLTYSCHTTYHSALGTNTFGIYANSGYSYYFMILLINSMIFGNLFDIWNCFAGHCICASWYWTRTNARYVQITSNSPFILSIKPHIFFGIFPNIKA